MAIFVDNFGGTPTAARALRDIIHLTDETKNDVAWRSLGVWEFRGEVEVFEKISPLKEHKMKSNYIIFLIQCRPSFQQSCG